MGTIHTIFSFLHSYCGVISLVGFVLFMLTTFYVFFTNFVLRKIAGVIPYSAMGVFIFMSSYNWTWNYKFFFMVLIISMILSIISYFSFTELAYVYNERCQIETLRGETKINMEEYTRTEYGEDHMENEDIKDVGN